jgi:rhodanese-related sulfurtransferase
MAETAPETVDTERARLLLAEGDVRVIDIRSQEEFADYRLPGSVNQPDADANAVRGELGEDDKVLIVCGSGERSAQVAGELRERGHEASSLDGGTEAWKSDRLPTQPSPDVDAGEAEPPKLPGAGT